MLRLFGKKFPNESLQLRTKSFLEYVKLIVHYWMSLCACVRACACVCSTMCRGKWTNPKLKTKILFVVESRYKLVVFCEKKNGISQLGGLFPWIDVLKKDFSAVSTRNEKKISVQDRQDWYGSSAARIVSTSLCWPWW